MTDLYASRRKAPRLAPQMSIVFRAIDQRQSDPTNSRRPSKQSICQIGNNIKSFGFDVSIVTDRDVNIIASDGRPLAAGEIGRAEMPTLCVDHLTQGRARCHAVTGSTLDDLAREAEAANAV